MIRMFALLAALLLAGPALAQRRRPAGRRRSAEHADHRHHAGPHRRQAAQRHRAGHAARLKQLARERFYDGVPFHRVIAGFMAQTGDGQNGNGTGGSKYPDLKAEFSNVPYKRGIVGMARKGNSND